MQILVANWDGALTLLRELKGCIEFTNAPPLEQLQQRSWLLHWSLFVFFNHANGRLVLRDDTTIFFLHTVFCRCHLLKPWWSWFL